MDVFATDLNFGCHFCVLRSRDHHRLEVCDFFDDLSDIFFLIFAFRTLAMSADCGNLVHIRRNGWDGTSYPLTKDSTITLGK